jgi:hydrogenase/urease accessory protein HupE
MKSRRLWLLLALLSCLFLVPAFAHESRPAYLLLRQVDEQTYDVLWKVPGLGEDKRLALDLAFAPGTTQVGATHTAFANNAFLQQWRVRHPGGLDGTSVRVAGLQATLTDVLVRLERSDGTTQTMRVTPASPEFVIEATPGRWDVTRTYLRLGIDHILSGIDHLLFVLALLLLVGGVRRMFWTITAFTAAHSLTLAAATLGWVHVPSPPVEASIALSIVFLASEILRARAGRPGLTSRAPWIVAFVFGLLHGLGFAGALSEIGLPQNAIPLALFFFNVGVEAGQLLFIATVLAVFAVLKRMPLPRREWPVRFSTYAIGTVAAYWTIERLSTF